MFFKLLAARPTHAVANSRRTLLIGLGLVISLLLVACGDATSTSVPSATSPATTAVSSTTAAVTSPAAATLVAGSTAAPSPAVGTGVNVSFDGTLLFGAPLSLTGSLA